MKNSGKTIAVLARQTASDSLVNYYLLEKTLQLIVPWRIGENVVFYEIYKFFCVKSVLP